MASTEEKLLTLLLSVEHLQHTAMQYIACGRRVQGVSSVLIRKIRRKRTYMFLSFVEKQCAPAEG